MTVVIEKSFIEFQKATTFALGEHRVILSEEQIIDNLLDRINDSKKFHQEKLIPKYHNLIEKLVDILNHSLAKSELAQISEAIITVTDTTKRLIRSLSEGALATCFIADVKELRILMNDIAEIQKDIQNRIVIDTEMADLLADIT